MYNTILCYITLSVNYKNKNERCCKGFSNITYSISQCFLPLLEIIFACRLSFTTVEVYSTMMTSASGETRESECSSHFFHGNHSFALAWIFLHTDCYSVVFYICSRVPNGEREQTSLLLTRHRLINI